MSMPNFIKIGSVVFDVIHWKIPPAEFTSVEIARYIGLVFHSTSVVKFAHLLN